MPCGYFVKIKDAWSTLFSWDQAVKFSFPIFHLTGFSISDVQEQIISLWELCSSPLPHRFPYPHRTHQFHFHTTLPMGCCHTQGRKCYFYRWFSFSALGLGNENGITLQAKWNENNFMFPEPHLWSLKVFSFSTQTEMYRQEEEFIFTVFLQMLL